MIETNYENLESWYGLRLVEKGDLGASVLQGETVFGWSFRRWTIHLMFVGQ